MRLKLKVIQFLKNLLGYSNTVKIKQAFFKQKYRFDELHLIYELLKGIRNGVMIDVGAHYGSSLFPFYQKGWDILAFEPDEVNRSVLKTLINPKKIKIFPYGVGNEYKEKVNFYRSTESSGISGLSPFTSGHELADNAVTIVTLRDIIADEGINEVTFLKVDTEGHDLFVLQGFPWEVCKPNIVMVEFEDFKTEKLGYNYHDMAKYFIEKGYTVYLSEWEPITKYGVSHTWRTLSAYPCELQDPKGWGNLIAFHEPPDSKIVNKYLSIFNTTLIEKDNNKYS